MTMRNLTDAEIEQLAARQGVRRIAVENFLGTLDTSVGPSGNKRNLWADAQSYKWNAATVAAIQSGIALAAK
jgi:hypothetical protein